MKFEHGPIMCLIISHEHVLKMQVPPKVKMCTVSRFLYMKSSNCTEIYWQLLDVYDEKARSRQVIVIWCNMFEQERKGIDDTEGRRIPSTSQNLISLLA